VTTRARKVPPAAEVRSPTRILRGKLGFPAEYGLGSRPDQISLWTASDRVASSPSSELARIGSREQTKDDRVWTIATSLTSNIRKFPDRLTPRGDLASSDFCYLISISLRSRARISAFGSFRSLFDSILDSHSVNICFGSFVHSTLSSSISFLSTS